MLASHEKLKFINHVTMMISCMDVDALVNLVIII